MARPKVLVLRAGGTNRDGDAIRAWEAAGADADAVHVNEVLCGSKHMHEYDVLNLPGGFAYGDDLGAGKLLAVDLLYRLREPFHRFVESGKLMLGICNGFQAMVKTGIIPQTTLYNNESGRFECRWVYLKPVNRGNCIWTRNMDELLYVPVAHGEGRFITADEATRRRLYDRDQVVFQYVDAEGNPAGYPGNPNGSVDAIAGVCNEAGNALGLMPHPEDHITELQHPQRTRRGGQAEGVCNGLVLFKNAVEWLQRN